MRYKVDVEWISSNNEHTVYYCENYQHCAKSNTLYLYDTEDELIFIMCLDQAKTCEFIQNRKVGF